jgi:hypothetical protein
MLVPTKNTGDSYTASEVNQVNDETEGSISDTGQTPSAGNLTQQSTAMSIYAAGGAFYTDSGAADAYVISTVGSKRAPIAYFDGMAIAFRAGNTNTGPSTVNVAGLGVKTIQAFGAAVIAGYIRDNNITTAVYNAGTGFFDLTSEVIREFAAVTGGAETSTTGAAVSKLTLDVGTVTAGDRIDVRVNTNGTKGITAGLSKVQLAKSSGTGTITFYGGNETVVENIISDMDPSAIYSLNLSEIAEVSVGGTMVLDVLLASDGSDTSYSAGDIRIKAVHIKKQ